VPVRRRGYQASREHRRAPVGGVPRGSVARGHDRFERLVERALDGLPAWVQPALEQVAIVIEDEPSADQRRTSELREEETLYGLYEGVPAVEYGADLVPLPNKITLFRWPLEADFADPAELAAEVRRTVLHELGHHLGIDDERLHSLGMD
jgi:predicted Zn-dependent protease with MMP-like domain